VTSPPAHLLHLALEAITSFAAYEVLQDAMLESGWWDVRLEAYRWDYKNRNGDRMALPKGIAAVLLFGSWSTTRWPLVEAHEARQPRRGAVVTGIDRVEGAWTGSTITITGDMTPTLATSAAILRTEWHMPPRKPQAPQRWWDGATPRRRGGR
jgi:hypothetical protein